MLEQEIVTKIKDLNQYLSGASAIRYAFLNNQYMIDICKRNIDKLQILATDTGFMNMRLCQVVIDDIGFKKWLTQDEFDEVLRG